MRRWLVWSVVTPPKIAAAVEESDEEKPGVILDYDSNGNVVSVEILDASKRRGNPLSVEYAVTR